MPYDDPERLDSPISGMGDEMLPDRGMPFDDLEEDELASLLDELEDVTEAPRDLSPGELADLLGEAPQDVSGAAAEIYVGSGPDEGDDALPDSGMGAAYPIMTDDIQEELLTLPAAGLEVPPALAAASMPVYGEAAKLDPSATTEKRAVPVSADDESTVKLFLTKERLLRLWDRMDNAQQDIRTKVPSEKLAMQLFGKVEAARSELLADRNNFEVAERKVNEVELRIAIIDRSRQDTPAAMALLVYEIVWTFLFMVFFFLMGPFLRDLMLVRLGADALVQFPTLASDMVVAAQAAMAGGLGGVIGALYALWRHVSRQLDFSKQFAMWYITNPIMGLFQGVLVFLVARLGMSALTIGAGSGEISSGWLIYLVALILGYQQNVFFDLIRRMLKVFQFKSVEEQSGKTAGD